MDEDALGRARACRAGAAQAPLTPPAQVDPAGEFDGLGAPVSPQRLDEQAALVDRKLARLGGLVVAALRPVRRAVAKEAATPFAGQDLLDRRVSRGCRSGAIRHVFLL
jgi:hypothetical protein